MRLPHRPSDGMIFLVGILDNRGNSEIFYCHDDESERQLIINFFETLNRIRPTIIGGYNSRPSTGNGCLKKRNIRIKHK